MDRKSDSMRLATLVLVAALPSICCGQQAPARSSSAHDAGIPETLEVLQQQIGELREAVADLRNEANRYREETRELRRQLEAVVAQQAVETSVGAKPGEDEDIATGVGMPGRSPVAEAEQDRIRKLEEQYQLLTGELSEQYQTKVESASRYRVRLSGVALFNVFDNFGTADSVDLPFVAEGTPIGQSRGSFGATLRQSQVGLQVLGPNWAGARTRGDVQFDFAGGFPNTPNGAVFGFLRLRTGTVRLDWANTSLVAGQDTPFFSPLSPTSVATLASPAFSYAGNLWTWAPQLRIDHRLPLSDSSSFTIQGGILDSITGEFPSGTFDRGPTAGEVSRQPGYATRLAWQHNAFGRSLTVGTGGYYNRQSWGFGRSVDGWAATADWSVPLSARFSIDGEFYRGRALGGFGAATGRSVVFSGLPQGSNSRVQGLDVIGGWSQIKFQPDAKVEFNAGYGLDNPFAGEIRSFPYGQNYALATRYGQYYLAAPLVKNTSYLFNGIYRPRSDLLLSLEYRHIRTFELQRETQNADQLNLVMGVLF